MGELDGRRVLVTGASSGIGEACARAIAADGGRVALLARSRQDLERLASELGGRAVASPADVTDRAALRGAVGHAADALGGIDGLVNAAGVARPGRIADGDPDDWRLMFDVNVTGLLEATHAALPHLTANDHADVVNLSSMSGRRRASVAMTVYSATKHAVHVISDGLAEELRPAGVRVTAVSPGFVRTPIFDEVPDDETRRRYQDAMQDQGLAVDDVARQVLHVLRQPAGVELVEIAMLSMRQGN